MKYKIRFYKPILEYAPPTSLDMITFAAEGHDEFDLHFNDADVVVGSLPVELDSSGTIYIYKESGITNSFLLVMTVIWDPSTNDLTSGLDLNAGGGLFSLDQVLSNWVYDDETSAMATATYIIEVTSWAVATQPYISMGFNFTNPSPKNFFDLVSVTATSIPTTSVAAMKKKTEEKKKKEFDEILCELKELRLTKSRDLVIKKETETFVELKPDHPEKVGDSAPSKRLRKERK